MSDNKAKTAGDGHRSSRKDGSRYVPFLRYTGAGFPRPRSFICA